MLSKGQKINERYEIIKSIGEGGMANVYLANDTILDRNVAIKVLRGDLSNDEKFVRRFQREALSVSNLSHKNIVEVYDVGEEDGNYYIVMEYLNGKTLKQLLKKRESLTLIEVIDIMTQIADGIAHAHEAYIIHRDIKPQNIIIEDNGLIKITDFGIAMALNATQLTQTNSVMGSVHYLPPEQASGKSSTMKSDIYSMGILMYELITGTVPFRGDNAVEIALKHMKEKIPSIRKQNPSIPQSVENILLKATAKNPRNRYENAKEMYEDLTKCLDEEHKNDKKIIFEYPENDLDLEIENEKTNKKKKTETKKKENLNEEKIEETKEIMNEITENNDNKDKIDTNQEKDNNDEVEDFFAEPKRKNILIIILTSFFLLLLISAGIFWLVTTKEVKDITVPNIVNIPVEEAIKILTQEGFTYTTETQNSDTIEPGYVIKTVPRAGSTRKYGDTVTIVESIGGDYHYLENYIGKNYTEIKAKLELLNIKVFIEKKTVEDKDKYKDKKEIILDQMPKYNENEKKEITAGDQITLYIPDIENEYPDMVNEGWSLKELIAYAEEYKFNFNVEDKDGVSIPKEKYNEYSNTKIIYQSRTPGDPIIEGVILRIKLNVTTTPAPVPENTQNQTPTE